MPLPLEKWDALTEKLQRESHTIAGDASRGRDEKSRWKSRERGRWPIDVWRVM